MPSSTPAQPLPPQLHVLGQISHRQSRRETFMLEALAGISNRKTVVGDVFREIRDEHRFFRQRSLWGLIQAMIMRRRSFAFQLLKQYFIFSDEDLESLEVSNSPIVDEETFHSLERLLETKNVEVKMYAFFQIKAYPRKRGMHSILRVFIGIRKHNLRLVLSCFRTLKQEFGPSCELPLESYSQPNQKFMRTGRSQVILRRTNMDGLFPPPRFSADAKCIIKQGAEGSTLFRSGDHPSSGKQGKETCQGLEVQDCTCPRVVNVYCGYTSCEGLGQGCYLCYLTQRGYQNCDCALSTANGDNYCLQSRLAYLAHLEEAFARLDKGSP